MSQINSSVSEFSTNIGTFAYKDKYQTVKLTGKLKYISENKTIDDISKKLKINNKTIIYKLKKSVK